jgi:hypothetical protein
MREALLAVVASGAKDTAAIDVRLAVVFDAVAASVGRWNADAALADLAKAI